MKRPNTAFFISLIIHLIVFLIFIKVQVESRTRLGIQSLPVEFNVPAPQPKLEQKKPKFEPLKVDTNRENFTKSPTVKIIKFEEKMDRRTAYRNIVTTDDSSKIFDMGTSNELNTDGSFSLRSGGMSSRPMVRGGKSRLVEFVDKNKGARKVVYCLDVSVSMGAADKLNMARNYLKDSLLNLDQDKDTFNVVAFSRDVHVFQPGRMVQVTADNVNKAINFLDQYTPQNIAANTKTDLLSPVLKALELKPSVIALVTDGLPTAGVTNPEKILQNIKEKNTGVKIFAIGMEMDMEQPEAWLMKAIADQNDGEFQFF